MGCDIHVIVEVYDENLGWVGIQNIGAFGHPNVNAFNMRGSFASVNFKDNKEGEEIPRRLNSEDYPDLSCHISNCWGFPVARDRNYRLFAELANVRGRGTRNQNPKGLPDDASDMSRLAFENVPDIHSVSWDNFHDAILIWANYMMEGKWDAGFEEFTPGDLDYNQAAKKWGYDLFGVEVQWEGNPYGRSPNNVRIVYGFDN